MFVGNTSGAIAWSAAMPYSNFSYKLMDLTDITSFQQYYSAAASVARFYSIFLVPYGFECMCLILSKLMLLGRLTHNAVHSSHVHAPEIARVGRMRLSGRVVSRFYTIMTGAAVLCAATALLASLVAAAFQVSYAGLVERASLACDDSGNSTDASIYWSSEADDMNTRTFYADVVQSNAEAAALLLIPVAFVVLVTVSVSMFRQVEHVAARALLDAGGRGGGGTSGARANVEVFVEDTMHAAAEQRRRLVAACVIVMIAFPVRAAFDFLQAYALFSPSQNEECGICDTCQSDPFLISLWLKFTPEFQPIVVALSSPLPLALSLWLITTAHARAHAIVMNAKRVGLGMDMAVPPVQASTRRTPLSLPATGASSIVGASRRI